MDELEFESLGGVGGSGAVYAAAAALEEAADGVIEAEDVEAAEPPKITPDVGTGGVDDLPGEDQLVGGGVGCSGTGLTPPPPPLDELIHGERYMDIRAAKKTKRNEMN